MNQSKRFGTCIFILLLLAFGIVVAQEPSEKVTIEKLDELHKKALDKRDDLTRRLAQMAKDASNPNAADAGKGIADIDKKVGEGFPSGRPLPNEVKEIADKKPPKLPFFSGANWKTWALIGLPLLLLLLLLWRRRLKAQDEPEKVLSQEEILLAQLTEDERKLYELFKKKKELVEKNTTELYRLFGEEETPESEPVQSQTPELKRPS